MRTIAIILLLCYSVTLAAQPLRVGIVQFPPHSALDHNQQASGSLVEAIKQALDAAQIEYRIHLYPAKRLFLRLSEGVVDVYIGLKSNPKYHNSVIYSKMPVGAIELVVYSLSESKLPTTLPQLLGKKLGLIRGFGYNGGQTMLNTATNKAHLSYSNSHKSALAMLQAGRINYLLDYRGPINQLLAEQPMPKLRSQTLNVLDLYIIIPKIVPNAHQLMATIERHYPLP